MYHNFSAVVQIVGLTRDLHADVLACACLIFQKVKINELGITERKIKFLVDDTQFIDFYFLKHAHAKTQASNCVF